MLSLGLGLLAIARPTRQAVLRTVGPCVAIGPWLLLPAAASIAGDPVLAELSSRLEDQSPTQQQASLGDTLGTPFGRTDNLVFPSWLEGNWAVESSIVGVAAPLGRTFLPADLAKVRLGAVAVGAVPPLRYRVRFARRADGAVVADRPANLRAVQDASAGYPRVQEVVWDGSQTLKVSYSPFGPNGTFPGPSRAEVFIQRRRQSRPTDSAAFAFAEATRTVLLAQGRSVTLSDAETLTVFERASGRGGAGAQTPSGGADAAGVDRVLARQRVMRFLTPNPNSAEGVLWQEARGRAVALLDYDLVLERVSQG
jgi:hypothetical protein